MKKHKPRQANEQNKVPEKANRILNGVLIVLALIAFRVWHLTVVQHEEKLENSRKPQTRVVQEKAERAPIVDRKGTLLAVNKVQYNASILYGPIRDLPRSVWKKDEKGKKVKSFYRKEYITKLSELLANELHLDSQRIEDLIHSKAAILGNVPCLLKENITEEEYFRLKMLEKDWPGLHGEIAAKRCYPLGPIGAEVIGFLGPISKSEYEKVTQEMSNLRQILTDLEEGENPIFPKEFPTFEEVSARLEELEKKAYSLNDLVGKAGVEASFDEKLRGSSGKHVYLSDIKGKFLKELENSQSPTSGEKIVLTLSAELQEYAEKLLGECEASQSQRSGAVRLRSLVPPNQPWIKGGALVVMNPKTGEVYALASFPRFDPNDFMLTKDLEESIEKRNKIHRWLEDERNIAHIWDFKTRFERERFSFSKSHFYSESREMTWENFLGFILPTKSMVLKILEEKNTLNDAIFVQRKINELIQLFQKDSLTMTAAKIFDFLYQDEKEVPIGVMITLQEKDFLATRLREKEKEVKDLLFELSPYFKSLPLNYEKLLLVDLYRISVDETRFPTLLLNLIGNLTLSSYRELCGRLSPVETALKKIIADSFSEIDFKKWREESFKEYLAEMRKIEKKEKKRVRPFIEYLDLKKEEMFESFWQENRWIFLTTFLTHAFDPTKPELNPYFEVLQNWQRELKEGAHKAYFWTPHYCRVKQLIESYEPALVLMLLKTVRFFDDLDQPLFGVYCGLKGKLGKHLASAFYPRYGFGFARSHAFRQAATVGSIFKLVSAYEALKQRYTYLKEHQLSTKDLNPLTIVDDKHRTGSKDGWNVGYTEEGKPIPMFYHGGRLPRSEHSNVGRIDLVHAIERSSNPYFSILAGDILDDPEDLCMAASLLGYGEKTEIDLPGEYGGRLPKDVAYNRTGLYAMAIGQHSLVGTPLQTAVMLSALANGGEILKPQILLKKAATKEVRWRIFLPLPIQNLILTGMKNVVSGERGTASLLRSLYPAEFTSRMIGKTSTAEIIESFGLDGSSGKLKVKQIWFGAIAYETADFTKPELVVVVYLRHGEFGKDAAPLAAKIIQKWRELYPNNPLANAKKGIFPYIDF